MEQLPKQIFVERLEFIGEVHMCFFVPRCEDSKQICEILEKHGGRLTTLHECFTHQISPWDIPQSNKFFKGKIIHKNWIFESVSAGKLLEYQDYELETECIRLDRDTAVQQSPYTITECIKLASISVSRKLISERKLLAQIQELDIFPFRNDESLRNRRKRTKKDGLQNTIQKMLDKNVRYCHSFSEVPYTKDEIERKKQKNEFQVVQHENIRAEESISEQISNSQEVQIQIGNSENGEIKKKREIFQKIAVDMIWIAKHYGKSVNEIHNIWQKVSTNRCRLIAFLEGNEIVKLWTEEEDQMLREPQSSGHQSLVRLIGEDEVTIRKKFLQIL